MGFRLCHLYLAWQWEAQEAHIRPSAQWVSGSSGITCSWDVKYANIRNDRVGRLITICECLYLAKLWACFQASTRGSWHCWFGHIVFSVFQVTVGWCKSSRSPHCMLRLAQSLTAQVQEVLSTAFLENTGPQWLVSVGMVTSADTKKN